MNDKAHPDQELVPLESERVEAYSDRAQEEKAFRLTVARFWAYDGLDTIQIAQKMNVDEADVYNVLQSAKEMVRR